MEKARRRHVPAFGEWNYYSSSSSPDEPQLPHSVGGAGAECWWFAPEPEACSDAWFRYSPPPRRAPAPKKARMRPAGGVVAAPAAAHEQHHKPCYNGAGVGSGTVRAARAPDAAGRAAPPAKGARRVVRPVDADLYRVPPAEDTVSSRLSARRKRATRSLWMGCLGLNCVA